MSELTEDFDREQGPRYAAELDQCAEMLQKIHPIGQVKAIGRLEVARALIEMVEELTKLRASSVSPRCDECGSKGPQSLYGNRWLCIECAELT